MSDLGGPAPPGWYRDTTGFLRWWDGRAWGPYAPAPDPAGGGDAGRTLAVLSHLGTLVGWFVVPLIVLLVEGQRNPFVRHHASEALNFQITFLLAWLGGFALLFAGAIPAAVADQPPFAFVPFALFPLMFVGFLAAMAMSVLGAVRAGQGVWWRYPVAVRFVKGAGPGPEAA